MPSQWAKAFLKKASQIYHLMLGRIIHTHHGAEALGHIYYLKVIVYISYPNTIARVLRCVKRTFVILGAVTAATPGTGNRHRPV